MEEVEDLQKMQAACEGLGLRLRIIFEQVSDDPNNYELLREVRLAQETSEEIFQWMAKLAEKGLPVKNPDRFVGEEAPVGFGTERDLNWHAIEKEPVGNSSKIEPDSHAIEKVRHRHISQAGGQAAASFFLFCQIKGCPGAAKHCWPDALENQLCDLHKMKGMVSAAVMRKHEELRIKYAAFNLENSSFEQFRGQQHAEGTVIMKPKVRKKKHQPYDAGSRIEPRNAQHKLEDLVSTMKNDEGMTNEKKNENIECEHAGCNKLPIFNFKGGESMFCAQHKVEGMIEIKEELWKSNSSKPRRGKQQDKGCCVHADCLSLATHNYFSGGVKTGHKPLFCSKHKAKGMVYLAGQSTWCQHPGCTTRGVFNLFGERKGKFCQQHKLEGMVNVRRSRWCERGPDLGCLTLPRFNYEGELVPRFCAPHKLEGMVNVVDKTCEHAGCNKSKVFNFRGEKRGRFCGTHKLDGMTNVVTRSRLVCAHAGCSNMAGYNFQGQRKGKFCSRHKVPGMVPASATRRCEHGGCGTQSSYNYEGEPRARFCSKHKLEGMVHLRGCIYPACARMSSFNYEGERTTKFCVLHRLEGMVDLRQWRQNLTCASPGCFTKPVMNFPHESFKKFCSKHKVAGMVNLQDKLCERAGCCKRSSFNFEGERGFRFCAQHRLEGMVNIASAAFRRKRKGMTS